MRTSVGAVAVWFCSGWMACAGWAQVDYEHPPIDYLDAPVHDPVAEFQGRLAAGEASLPNAAPTGYLAGFLQALDVPVSSQVLVFSKTSLQQTRISPRRPRALYFNDDVYVGWVPRGDVLEIAAIDPQQGTIFYTVDQRSADDPHLQRQTHNCLVCHASSHTEGVPGPLVRSVFSDESGQPILSAGTFRTDYRSPLRERWGGWYVTGTHGAQRHMGNVLLPEQGRPEDLDVEAGANVVDLHDRLNLTQYLSPHSDIVALMVLEHQLLVHNRITAANYSARLAARDAEIMREALGTDPGVESESVQRRLDAAAEKLVTALLLVDEASLSDPVRGTSSFATEFQQRGPFDAQGRSLRQLDLETRLFHYPCSYLIYSPSFAALPASVRDRVLRRMWTVLRGEDQSEPFRHLSPADRANVLDILCQTLPDLPAYWREG